MLRLPNRAVSCALAISTLLILYTFHTTSLKRNILSYGSRPLTNDVHPVRRLFEDNSRSFTQKLARQSKTLDDAITEYKRRYGRSPPPGFAQWFSVAQENSFQFIDEFDVVMASMEPFWGVDPEILRSRVESLRSSSSILDIAVNKTGAFPDFENYFGQTIAGWLADEAWTDILPTLNMMVNILDEPRITTAHDSMDQAMLTAQASKTKRLGKWYSAAASLSNKVTAAIKWVTVGGDHVWEPIDTACRIDSPARSGRPSRNDATFGSLPFVTNLTRSIDVCDSVDMLHGHGMLTAPSSMLYSHNLVPVFSQCKLSIFNDILYPSPYYQGTFEESQSDEEEDVPWEEKLNRLYWSGSSTGGFATDDDWMSLHRLRMGLTLSRDSQQPVTLLSKNLQSRWEEYTSTWSTLSDLIYYKITHIVQSTEGAREQMLQHFNNTSEPRQAALKSRYALDIDGNSFSGRYYRLLKSRVCVLKQTALQEWHDGRLIPWVHFIPVSPGGEELGEIVRYLTQEEGGMFIGRTIAESGRNWARDTLRAKDFELVFVRILLEYNRLMSDNRTSYA